MISSYVHRLTAVSASEEENPLWLVVLCDMMTNLMLFFLIMYGFTRQPLETRAAMMREMSDQFQEKPVPDVQKKVEQVLNKVREDDLTETLKRKNFPVAAVNEKAIRVSLPGPVLFASGGDDLDDSAQAVLRQLADTLRDAPNAVVVEGHTDNSPVYLKEYNSNWELSVGRAAAVVEFLTRSCGLPSHRFVVAGYGEHRPVATNTTAEGRAQNRRIDVSILRAP